MKGFGDPISVMTISSRVNPAWNNSLRTKGAPRGVQHAIGSSDEVADLGGAVVRRDFLALVLEQVLAVFQTDTGGAQAPPEGAPQVVYTDSLESLRRCGAEVGLVMSRGSRSGCFAAGPHGLS